MIKSILNIKVALVLIFTISFGSSFASFDLSEVNFDKIRDKEKGNKAKFEKYSLKNIHRPASFFSLSSSNGYGDANFLNPNNTLLFPNKLQLIDNDDESNQSSDGSELQINSNLQINTGKAVVIYPFNFKVKSTPLGLFKTPTAPTR